MTNLNYVLENLPGYFKGFRGFVYGWGLCGRNKQLAIVAAIGRRSKEYYQEDTLKKLLDEASHLIVFAGYRNEAGYLGLNYNMPEFLDYDKNDGIGRHYDYDSQCEFYSFYCPFKDEEV